MAQVIAAEGQRVLSERGGLAVFEQWLAAASNQAGRGFW